jgi:hypothetical protein
MELQKYVFFLDYFSNVVNKAVAKGILNDGTLPPEILQLEGMSSHAIRILLNEICKGLPGANYLEIGSWRGSTFISALYNNKETKGTSIDSHSEYVNHPIFKTTAEMLKNNCERNLTHGENYELITADCFEYKLPADKQYSIYLFDGPHDYDSQYKALSHYYDNLEDIFIYICDDYSVRDVEEGTVAALKDLDIQVVTDHKMFGYQAIPSHMTTGFWNGYYVAVCVKRKSFPDFFKVRADGSKYWAHRFSEPPFEN